MTPTVSSLTVTNRQRLSTEEPGSQKSLYSGGVSEEKNLSLDQQDRGEDL